MFSSTNEGSTSVRPVLALPIGLHVLIESRADLRNFISQENNMGPFHGNFTVVLE